MNIAAPSVPGWTDGQCPEGTSAPRPLHSALLHHVAIILLGKVLPFQAQSLALLPKLIFLPHPKLETSVSPPPPCFVLQDGQ